jgi:hypothetical protein
MAMTLLGGGTGLGGTGFGGTGPPPRFGKAGSFRSGLFGRYS